MIEARLDTGYEKSARKYGSSLNKNVLYFSDPGGPVIERRRNQCGPPQHGCIRLRDCSSTGKDMVKLKKLHVGGCLYEILRIFDFTEISF